MPRRGESLSTDILTRCRNFLNVWKKHGPSPSIPTAIELRNRTGDAPRNSPSPPHKGRRGSGRGGPFFIWIPLSPALSPLVPRGEREKTRSGNALNSMAVGIKGEGPCFFHTLRKSLHQVWMSVLLTL